MTPLGARGQKLPLCPPKPPTARASPPARPHAAVSDSPSAPGRGLQIHPSDGGGCGGVLGSPQLGVEQPLSWVFRPASCLCPRYGMGPFLRAPLTPGWASSHPVCFHRGWGSHCLTPAPSWEPAPPCPLRPPARPGWAACRLQVGATWGVRGGPGSLCAHVAVPGPGRGLTRPLLPLPVPGRAGHRLWEEASPSQHLQPRSRKLPQASPTPSLHLPLPPHPLSPPTPSLPRLSWRFC